MSQNHSNDAQDDGAESSSLPSNTVPSIHVRRLNFGQSTADLNVENDQNTSDSPNISQIPCTQKNELVRRWIETHGQHGSRNKEKSSFPASSIRGELPVKRANMSPDLSNSKKRARIASILNNNNGGPSQRVEIEYENSQRNDDTVVSSTTKNKRETIDFNNAQDMKENIFTPPTNSAEVRDTKVSPIISRGHYKRRVLKFRKTTWKGKSLCARFDDLFNPIKIRELNSSSQSENILHHLLKDGTRDIYNNNKTEKGSLALVDLNQVNAIDSNHMENDNIESTSNVTDSQRELNIEDSPKLETERASIDMDSVTKEPCDMYVDIDSLSSNERDENDIDDGNSTEALPKNRNSLTERELYGANADTSSEISNDSDATYFPEAEEILAKARSDGTFHVSSTTKEISQSTSNRTSVNISNVTSPQPVPETSKTITLSYPERKISKPKKGTQSERLVSLINNQTSFVRIWRHQTKQSAKDNVPIQAVKVYVEKCVDLYSRQFLEGYVVDDPFNLLPDPIVNRDESSTSRAERRITLMTVPEIVGKISMETEFMVQIGPPWQVMDNENLLLRVTYLSLLAGKNGVNIEKVLVDDNEQKRCVIQDFDCPCMQADKVLPNCAENNEKPDVMANLFSE